MYGIIELTTAAAAQVDNLTRLIRQRKQNAAQIERHIAQNRDILSPARRKEQECHLTEVKASIDEMNEDYRRIIANESSNNNHIN